MDAGSKLKDVQTIDMAARGNLTKGTDQADYTSVLCSVSVERLKLDNKTIFRAAGQTRRARITAASDPKPTSQHQALRIKPGGSRRSPAASSR